MKWKAFFALLSAYLLGVVSCIYLVVTLTDQPRALEQFLLWIGAGAVIVPLILQSIFDW